MKYFNDDKRHLTMLPGASGYDPKKALTELSQTLRLGTDNRFSFKNIFMDMRSDRAVSNANANEHVQSTILETNQDWS